MSQPRPLPTGKLPPGLLAEVLGRIDAADPRVIVGAAPGEDAAVIDAGGDRLLVASTDPVTFATDRLGWYLVHVNANDIAVAGAAPRWLMATVLLPPGSTDETVRSVFDQMLAACGELGITLVGGHTEVTYGLERPIGIGAMLGEVERGREVRTSGVRPGDAIVATKHAAIEGTAVLAREAEDSLVRKGLGPELVARAKAFLDAPGISVVKEAAIAATAASVHAMHDPTEGGLATGLREMADASGTGLTIDEDAVSYAAETEAVCQALEIDPFGLIASGCLLIAVGQPDAGPLIDALGREGIGAAVIGRATDRSEGLRLRTKAGPLIELPVFERDELARYFGG